MSTKNTAESKKHDKKQKTAKAKKVAADPTTDEALLALSPEHAEAPDMPVDIARREIASLARLALREQGPLSRIGIAKGQIDNLGRFAERLGALEKAWKKARGAVKLGAGSKKLQQEAEALDSKLVAGGRWACRRDQEAQEELSRIAAGSGLADTIQDLRDLVEFWAEHADALSSTDITKQDLARAEKLADQLDAAAAHEASDVDAARALALRNRAFWAADDLASDIREGARYAFRDEPKVAAKFVSRYRTSAKRRSRAKAKSTKDNAQPEPAITNGAASP